MRKLNKKIVICIIVITIICMIIYKNFFKQEDYALIESIKEEINEGTNENENLDNIINQIKSNNTNKIVVYITGAINNSGVYEIEENSRIADIIEYAGGLTENADIKEINLAYIIQDGMKIYIPERGEDISKIIDNTDIYVTKENNSFNVENKETNTKSNTKININTATQKELETLPGIGPSIALNIIEYRRKKGKFNTIDEIKNVSGIGSNKFQKIKDFINI